MQHIFAQVMHLRFSWSSDNNCKKVKRFTISRSYKSNIDATFDLMAISITLNQNFNVCNIEFFEKCVYCCFRFYERLTFYCYDKKCHWSLSNRFYQSLCNKLSIHHSYTFDSYRWHWNSYCILTIKPVHPFFLICCLAFLETWF